MKAFAIDSVANTFDIIVIQLLAKFKWLHAVCSHISACARHG